MLYVCMFYPESGIYNSPKWNDSPKFWQCSFGTGGSRAYQPVFLGLSLDFDKLVPQTAVASGNLT